MISCPDSSCRKKAAFLRRSFLLALLGLLCLSNVAVQPVQGQGASSGTSPPSSTTSGAATGTPSGTVTSPATGTPSGTIIGTATGTATAPAPTVSRSPQDPVSSLTMLNPKANLQNPPLFPIGVDIDFAWDYDKYLKLQPTNLTIEAFMTNSPTTIITLGAALPGNLKNYTWTAANQKNITHPIQTAMYTLRIFDGAVGRSGSLPQGGYLITYSGLKFGLYAPNTYTPGSQMNPPICATCEFSGVTNNALRTMLPGLAVLLATVASTFAVLI